MTSVYGYPAGRKRLTLPPTREEMQEVFDRFYVPEPNSGCWLWVGGPFRNGYGMLWVSGVLVTAHRYSYSLCGKEIPAGFVVHHKCENKACVNPDHLAAVTQRENILASDTLITRNMAKTHCPKGHPLSGDNLVAWVMKKGRRECRACNRASTLRYMRRRRAALRCDSAGKEA